MWLDRLLGLLTRWARKPDRPPSAPLPLGPEVERERRLLESRRRQHDDELRQIRELSLAEAEVEALRVDAEVIGRDYYPPPRREHRDGEDGPDRA